MSSKFALKENRTFFSVDRLGVIASAACFIHCLLTPIVLSLSVVSAHFLPSEERTHRVLAVFVASFGALAFIQGYRLHRKRIVPSLMAIGISLIFFAAWWGDRFPTHAAEVLVTLSGSCFMIAAHRMNHTFCKACERCEADRCG